MHSRRFACLLIGLWLGGGFLMAWIAADNPSVPSRMMSSADPAASLRVRALGPVEVTALLRHEAAEITRDEQDVWGFVEIGLGAFLFCFLLFGTQEGKLSLAIALLMLIGAAVQRLFLTPPIHTLGRLTDFMSTDAAAGYKARTMVLQGAYVGVEIAKWVMGACLAATLIGGRRPHSRNSWQQINVVNKPNHRHVNR